jgi:hypothetical protein
VSCVSFDAWMPHALFAALAFGMAIGVSLNLGVYRLELAAYRRIAKYYDTKMETK